MDEGRTFGEITIKILGDRLEVELIHCPNCGNLAYIKDKNPPEVKKVVLTVGNEVIGEYDVNELPKVPLICPWCQHEIEGG